MISSQNNFPDKKNPLPRMGKGFENPKINVLRTEVHDERL